MPRAIGIRPLSWASVNVARAKAVCVELAIARQGRWASASAELRTSPPTGTIKLPLEVKDGSPRQRDADSRGDVAAGLIEGKEMEGGRTRNRVRESEIQSQKQRHRQIETGRDRDRVKGSREQGSSKIKIGDRDM